MYYTIKHVPCNNIGTDTRGYKINRPVKKYFEGGESTGADGATKAQGRRELFSNNFLVDTGSFEKSKRVKAF